MLLEPYLFFSGTCAQALREYETIFGGKAELTRIGDTPAGAHMPADQHDRIMHATFKAEGISFMASDGRPGTTYESGNVSLAIGMSDRKEADRIYAALAQGGTADHPMKEEFWGAYFGTVTDRYGIDWMINCE